MEKGPPPPYAPSYDQTMQPQQGPYSPTIQHNTNSYPSFQQQPMYAAQQPYQTVVTVGPPQPVHHHTTTTIVVEKNVNHCLHCCISIFFPPWVFVWIFLCLTN